MNWFVFVLISTFVNSATGKQLVSIPGTKTWSFNINFHNPTLWTDGQLPRSCDRAVIPAKTTVSVFIQSNITVRELVLPLNGEIVLGSGASLNIEENSKECSDGKDVELSAPTIRSWYTPDSWSVSPEDTPEARNPVPEIERIPCQVDHVVFPVNSSYQVTLEQPPPVVDSISIAGKNLSTEEFEAMLETPSGKLHFTSLTLLVATNTTCSEIVGCACGNNKPQVKSLVCRSAKCKDLDCSDPVKPVGSCCPLCGATVTINYKSGFEFSKLQKLCSSFMTKPEYESVSGYVSNIGDNRVQAIFSDSQETHRAASLARAIVDYLDQDMKQVGSYGIATLSYQASSHWIEHFYLDNNGLSMGQIFGLSILFVALVGLAIYSSTKFKKYNLSSLSFKRLQELKDDLDYDNPEEAQEVTSFPPESTAKGFDNPMYDELKASAKEALDSSSGSEPQSKVVSTEMRENPAFTVFEELEHLTHESLLE